MWGLAYRDFLVGKKDVFLYGGIILLLSAVFFVPYREETIEMASVILPIYKFLCILGAFLCLGALQQSLLNMDERKGYRYFMCTTPVLSDGAVRERFLFNFVSTAVLSSWLAFASYVQAALTGQNCGEVFVIFSLFYIHLLILALDVPFYFRFGVQYGKYYKMGLFLAVVFFLLWFILYGEFGKEASLYALVEWSLSIDPAAVFARFSVFTGIAPWLVLLLYCASYRLSCRCYRRSYTAD